MKILVVGGGGREHSLCWAISKSPKCESLYCAPGNAGIEEIATCINIEDHDIPGIVLFSKSNSIDLVVIGPEKPLVMGLVDALEAENIVAFGPKAGAANLEGSKAFMKDLFKKYNIPTASYEHFNNFEQAKNYICKVGAPIVIKASGLAEGKGVVIAQTLDEAIKTLNAMMNEDLYGNAGHEVVIEEFLEGEEASFFALVDGETAVPLLSAQDHKRAFDGDEGPNTGGMGAYAPAPCVSERLSEEIMRTIIGPTIKGMAAEGFSYRGVLFAGLMIKENEIKTLEFNIRFGDPECQVLMKLLDCDIVDLLTSVTNGTLSGQEIKWKKGVSIVVIMAANGYPKSYEKGSEIKNLRLLDNMENVTAFHAGTKFKNKKILANGGRVLGITATGKNIQKAQKVAYSALERIDWKQGFYRKDIGWRAIERNKNVIN